MKIGQIGERGLALEGEMDHTRKSCWIIYIENYVESENYDWVVCNERDAIDERDDQSNQS